MQGAAIYVSFGFVILLLGGIGCGLRFGKAYWLINGYRSMPEDKKKNVDFEGMARFLGNCLLAGSGAIAAATALLVLKADWAGVTLLCLLLPGLVYMVVRAQKFDGNARRSDGRMSAQTKVTLAMLVIVLGGAAAGLFFLIDSGNKPAAYEVTADALEIKCAFGGTVKLADIRGLELAGARPGIASRTFGSALGEILRGSFELADGKPAKLYAENAASPFVHFTAGHTEYYINGATPDATKALFAELEKALK